MQVWWKEYNQTTHTLPEYIDLTSAPKDYLDTLIQNSPWYNNCAENIDPKIRVETQAILQKYTTHSISSTVNVAKYVNTDYIRTIYEHAWNSGLKGITIYRDQCRAGILVKEEPTNHSSKDRPKELECKVVQFKNEKKDWIALIGLLNGYPHEIFTGVRDIDQFPIPTSVTDGTIIKVKNEDEKSRYDFRYIDSYGYTNTLGGLSRVFDKEYWNYGRFTSGLLRSRVPINEIVKIIDSLTFTNKGMNNWKSGVIRALKPFIEEGTKAEGDKCDNCGSTMVYEGGCVICKSCGSSRCG